MWIHILWLTGLLAWAKCRIAARGGTVVLTLHRVLPDPEYDDTCSPKGMVLREETFESLARFVAHRYETVNLSRGDLPTGNGHKRPRLAFTFDDGWKDTAQYAFPIARRHGIPLTVFICPGRVGCEFPFWPERVVALYRAAKGRGLSLNWLREEFSSDAHPMAPSVRPRNVQGVSAESLVEWLKTLPEDRREAAIRTFAERVEGGARAVGAAAPDATMTWSDMAVLAEGGVTFGSHTQSHPILTRMPEVLARPELLESKANIERRLGIVCRLFAYPNGNWSPRIRDLAEQAGYELAFTTRPGVWTGDCDPLLVPRVNVWEGTVVGFSGRFSRRTFEYGVFWRAYRGH